MSDHDLLNALPLELQLYIVEAVPVGERRDRAALALASPHLLAACREQLPSYQGLEIAIAFHLVLGGTIDEQLLRRYGTPAAQRRRPRAATGWRELPRRELPR